MFNVLSFLEGAQELYYKFKDTSPVCVGKLGNAELMCLYNYHYCTHTKQHPIPWSPTIEKEIYVNAGVFPQTEKARIDFCIEMGTAVQNADIMSPWNNGLGDFEKRFIKVQNPNCILVDLCALEPYYSGIPWTHHLKDKNVLVISPFAETIKKQYKMKDKIWSNGLLPKFNLITINHPTSKAISSNTQNPYNSWTEMVDAMKQKMSSVVFDVALIGTGASSLPLAAHAKVLGKQSIHLGGPLQILFGIKGRRWDSNKTMQAFYNDHWARPSQEETPSKSNEVEGGCYW